MNPRLGPAPALPLRTHPPSCSAGVAPPAGLRADQPVRSASRSIRRPALLKDALTANLDAASRAIRRCAGLAGAARSDGRVDHAPPRPRPARPRDAGDSRHRQPRGASSRSRRRCSIRRRPTALVVCPNPFYQIYEGAHAARRREALASSTRSPRNGFRPDWDGGARVACGSARACVYACSPNNPNGRVMPFEEWKLPLRALRPPRLRDRLRRVLQRDLLRRVRRRRWARLAAAKRSAAQGYPRLLVMGSLSKRSNAPGAALRLRRGRRRDPARASCLYRTYHGTGDAATRCSLASIAAWKDEAHVVENRRLYREKFAAFHDAREPGAARSPCPRPRSITGPRVRRRRHCSSRATSTPPRTSPCCRAASSAARPMA